MSIELDERVDQLAVVYSLDEPRSCEKCGRPADVLMAVFVQVDGERVVPLCVAHLADFVTAVVDGRIRTERLGG